MATMILSTAGASLGSSAGGTLLGMGASTLGRAAGGIAGSLIDRQVLGRGSQPVEGGRVERIRVQGAGEGEPIPRLFGRMRVGGQVIWSSRFTEHVDESGGGGKGGGQTSRQYRYTLSFAVALCEGRIRRIGRVWADGNEISIADYSYRLYKGGEAQQPDPLIDDIEGGAPAFRGMAYLVFEEMPLEAFGNRIPQLNIEVWREPDAVGGSAEYAPPLSGMVKGVALSPGSGEFSLETEKIRRITGPGQTAYENVNTISERPDLKVALDQLEAEAPNCGAVSLIVSWFGDDLRCNFCDIRPCIETGDKDTAPEKWKVNGISRGGARQVSVDTEGRPIYGGTPSDGSVIRAIREMNSRGMKVMFYPFILMDVPEGNSKPDPWTGEIGQPAFPWRGRITMNRAPGVAGSPDKTALAADQVATFFGAAKRGDFSRNGNDVSYSGPAEWSFRRFILHYAHLCAAAGGVDSFCIGSEMRSLTQIRSDAGVYPAIRMLRQLAADVRVILGADVKISYAADWSEYFGHRPGDGSGDVYFHLDPLWADENIDFIGIDNYLPLADWRYREGHTDEDAGSVYSLPYLEANVEGGEGFDWYYADEDAREAQIRTPIADTAHGEDWLFRPKDIRNWWSNPHHNRPGGVRAAASTAWVPQSKPVWFTEIGCPAVDLGANQPNVFVDPKSSETALPYYSRGVRDDYMQRRYLQAALGHWAKPVNNPVSSVYGGRMIDLSRTFIWTWDARPWPDFPNRNSVWSDGPNHMLGHWITGRLGAASLADVVAEICLGSGLRDFDVSGLSGVVQGFMIDDAGTARGALQSLMKVFAFDAVESGEVLKFRHRNRPVDGVLPIADAIASKSGGAEISYTRSPEGDLAAAISFGFVNSERDYEAGAVEARSVRSASARTDSSSAPVLLDDATAQGVADRYLAEIHSGREGVNISVARCNLALEAGDIVSISDAPGNARYRVDGVEDAGGRALTLTRIEPRSYAVAFRQSRPAAPTPIFPAAPVLSRFMDLPLISGTETGPQIAAFADPWAGSAALYVANGDEDFQRAARATRPATMGELATDLPAAIPGLWTRDIHVDVRIYGGSLSSVTELSVLNGANRAAVLHPSGEWEVLQFQKAELVGSGLWRLSLFLRGQAGTEMLAKELAPAGAAFVVLDNAVTEIASLSAFRGVERNWRIGPDRKPVSDESFTGFVAADNAIRLRPYSPSHLRAVRDPVSDDFYFTWIRRVRIGGDSWAGADPPLDEGREAYLLRIGDSPEMELREAQFTWSAAERAASGLSGAVEVAVSQISDQFGPGPEAKVTIHV